MAAPNISIGPNPTANPTPGDFWYDSVKDYLFIRFQHSDWSQWVVANPGTGKQGPKGDKGDNTGLPAGGSAGQYLNKKTNADYDFQWSGLPAGGGDGSGGFFNTAADVQTNVVPAP